MTGWLMIWSSCWNDNWQEKPKYGEKTYPDTSLGITISHDLTWDGTLAANCPSESRISPKCRLKDNIKTDLK
jgi:hypothetical protein